MAADFNPGIKSGAWIIKFNFLHWFSHNFFQSNYSLACKYHFHIWQVSLDHNCWIISNADVIQKISPRLLQNQLECGTWYHHPQRLQCVLSRNHRIFKVATWHYRCHHNLKNNCIWDNLQCCLLVPRSSSKPVMWTFDLQSRKILFIEIVFWHV